MVRKNAKNGRFLLAQHLREPIRRPPRGTPMPRRKRHARATAAQHRDHHRQALHAVLYLSAVLLLVNAWLISQQVIRF